MSTHTYDFEKPWPAQCFVTHVIGFGLILSEGVAYRKQRKALTPAFNIKNIRALYPLIWEKYSARRARQRDQDRSGRNESSRTEWKHRAERLGKVGKALLQQFCS